jgi:FkbM family methyltransferase
MMPVRKLIRSAWRKYRDSQYSPFRYRRTAYSQGGEDLILARLVHGIATGFYIDVGAHHPQRFSNTYLLYKKGWRGINIDALPGSMAEFRRLRPRDINLELAIGEREGTLPFYTFEEPAFNTFDAELVQSYKNLNRPVKAVIEMPIYRLEEVIAKYLPPGQRIDVLTIDVEGLDLAVLRSNNWELYRPTYLLTEIFGEKVDICDPSPAGDYVRQQGYSLVAHTTNTAIFKDRLTKSSEDN